MSDEFELFSEIPIDEDHTLEQLTALFRCVKDGLPELVKNAKDQYSRLGVLERDQRQILVLAETKKRRLAVLDFAGAAPADFDGWKTWSSRTAHRRDLADDIEGGHGNGGKAFMVRGSATVSYMNSCSEGHRTKMGFRNHDPNDRYKPGFARQKGTLIHNIKEPAPEERLGEELSQFGITLDDLPAPAAKVMQSRSAFTIAVVSGVVDWQNRRPATVRRLAHELPVRLAEHGQAALSVDTCSVWVVVDGALITDEPLSIHYPDPHPGFEDLSAIPIPQQLVDPVTDEEVDTGAGDPDSKYLQLHTSEKNLRMSDDLQARNVIRVWNARNNVATLSLPNLVVGMPSVAFIYGELRVPGLDEQHLQDAHRSSWADTALTRVLRQWVMEEVETLARKIQKQQMKNTKPDQRERAQVVLDDLRDLMQRYLDPEDVPGDMGDGHEDGGKGDQKRGDKHKRKGAKYGSEVNKIDLEPTQQKLVLALGTEVPLAYRCLSLQPDGKPLPVRGIEVNLCTELGGHAELSTEGMLTAKTAGQGQMWLETADGAVSSERMNLEVIECTDCEVVPPAEPLRQGEKRRLRAYFATDTGPRDDVMLDATIDEPGVALVGRGGVFTAGDREATATLRVRYGPGRDDYGQTRVQIGPERVPPTDQAGGRASTIPRILFCGQEAPGREAYRPEQRTHEGGEHFPTIIDFEPHWKDVVWLNHASREAMRVRKSRGGPSGVQGIDTATFLDFAALKCFEVLKRLWIRQELRERTVNEQQFRQYMSQAEISCADFIDDAYELTRRRLTEMQDG